MDRSRQSVCPGCSRHCRESDVRCKFGHKHFERIQKKQAEEKPCEKKKESEKRRRKWEKHVQQGGLIWKLLLLGSRSKKALRKGKLTEMELLAALDQSEQAQLDALIEKLLRIAG